MTNLARLRDCFMQEREPERALFCTYGLEPTFFENEILPALFPDSLGSDRKSGSTSAYLNAADQLTHRRDIVVLGDHTEAGKEFIYPTLLVKGRSAFHPKLMLLDYGQHLRVIVSSANLTRSGWVHQLELFVYEDLPVGGSHAWAGPLTSFLEGVSALMAEQSTPLEPFLERVRTIDGAPSQGLQLLTTFDHALLEQALQSMDEVTAVEIVSPFFEGEGGPGVFDVLRERFPRARGRLFVRAQTGDDGVEEVFAPASKVAPLLDEGGWSLHQVLDTWEGDEDDAPPRGLHGKLLALRHRRRAIAMIGSPNFTRAALLEPAPIGNVEAAVLVDLSTRRLDDLLPQHRDLVSSEIRFRKPPDEEAASEPGPERYISAAIYRAAAEELEVSIVESAPPLSIRYEGKALANRAIPPGWQGDVRLGRSIEIEVIADGESAVVPLVIDQPGALAPRGMARQIGFEEFLDSLAGSRELPLDEDDSWVGSGHGSPVAHEGMLRTGGVIAWRKLLRALERLGQDFRSEARFPRGIDYLIINPARLAGLRTGLGELVVTGWLKPADHAFALHEVRRMLSDVLEDLRDQEESAAHVRDVLDEVTAEFRGFHVAQDGALRTQLDQLWGELR